VELPVTSLNGGTGAAIEKPAKNLTAGGDVSPGLRGDFVGHGAKQERHLCNRPPGMASLVLLALEVGFCQRPSVIASPCALRSDRRSDRQKRPFVSVQQVASSIRRGAGTRANEHSASSRRERLGYPAHP
jgi:hypothetical protein